MWIIGIENMYEGISYFNKEAGLVGAKHFATKYPSEEAANEDTCALMRFFKNTNPYKSSKYNKVVVKEI